MSFSTISHIVNLDAHNVPTKVVFGARGIVFVKQIVLAEKTESTPFALTPC